MHPASPSLEVLNAQLVCPKKLYMYPDIAFISCRGVAAAS
jgi:hypothetical protein